MGRRFPIGNQAGCLGSKTGINNNGFADYGGGDDGGGGDAGDDDNGEEEEEGKEKNPPLKYKSYFNTQTLYMGGFNNPL